jgi:hypothetical protein
MELYSEPFSIAEALLALRSKGLRAAIKRKCSHCWIAGEAEMN